MGRYSSTRHRKLMAESEYALQVAANSPSERISRIVSDTLRDRRLYRQWEATHASLLLPVAEHTRTVRQIVALRLASVRLVHRRALFRYLREHQLRGEKRRQLIRIFHSTLDYEDAVVAEHRQYRLAMSSRVSTGHLIDVMDDPTSIALLRDYECVFSRYFAAKCYVAGVGDSRCVELVRLTLDDTRAELRQIRHRIESEPPAPRCGTFDRRELLARSGRYPMLNYMVG